MAKVRIIHPFRFITFCVLALLAFGGLAGAETQPQKVLSVGDVLSSPDGNLTVKKISAAGSPGEGILHVATEIGGRPGSVVVDANELSVLLRPGDSLADLPGAVVKSIDEAAGRAVLVKYVIEQSPTKPRRALLFLNSEAGVSLVSREGEKLSDNAALSSIDRFSEANGRIFMLGKVRQTNGKVVQSLSVWHDGQMNELVRCGTTRVADWLVKSIVTLVPAAGSSADNRWIDATGRIAMRLTFQNGSRAMVMWESAQEPQPGQNPHIYDITGNDGISGGKILQVGLPALQPLGIVYRALQPEPGKSLVWTIYATDPKVGLHIVDYTGNFATENPVTFLRSFADPVAGDEGSFAYLATFGFKQRTWRALFWYVFPYPTLVVREGDFLPGSDTERFVRIKSVVLPHGTTRGPLFTAMTANGLSLWATDNAGLPTLVVKPGMTLTFDSAERIVASVRALEGGKGAGIAARGYDEFGQVEALIKFTDGTESLIQFTLP